MSLSCALNAATAGGRLPVADYIALAPRHGYSWIELNRVHLAPLHALGHDAAQDLLQRAGVGISSFFLPVDWLAQEQPFERQLQDFEDLVPFLAGLGATRCCTWLLPNLPRPAAEMHRVLGVRFDRIATVLDRHGLKFGLEFLGPAHFRDDPGFTFLYRLEDMLTFAEEIGGNVGVLVDSFHWHCLGSDTEALAAVPPDRLIYAHINDARDVPREAQRDDDRLLPGEGVIDLRGFLNGLRATGYSGPVGIEVDGPYLQQATPDDAAAAARQAWDAVVAS